MKVIILSAGKGTRMMPLTKNTPKPLLDIGEGVTIIESQLNSLAQCKGIDEVIFVVGYRAEQIEAKLKTYTKIPLRFIYNPFYDSSNNLISLWLAMIQVPSDFVIINGDNLFKPHLLQSLLDDKRDNSAVMVVTRKEKYDEEDMKVLTKDDQLLTVGKTINVSEATGESIGMIMFRGTARKYFMGIMDAMVRHEDSKQIFYLEAIQEMVDSGFPVHLKECAKEDWAEVDFHPDLNLVRSNMMRYNFFTQ
jgi:choline kinase